MLKKFLSAHDCAKCRFCCVFSEDDLWEMPAVSEELRKLIHTKYGLTPRYRDLSGNAVFGGDFDEDGILSCPMLRENGCVLKDEKPFECRVWPFRVMDRNGKLVITVSPLCKPINKTNRDILGDFAESELKMVFREELKKNPNIVKPYIDDYPVVSDL